MRCIARDDRTERGTEGGGIHKSRHGHATLPRIVVDVCIKTTEDRIRRGSSNSAKSAKDEESRIIRGQSTRHGEDDVAEIRADEDRATTPMLTHGPKDLWSDCKAHEEQGIE